MSNARVSPVAVWVLSVLLAVVFLVAGIPKLVGGATPWLQAAAMRGFPDWIRIVVGIVEVVSAIGLLVPAVSALFAVGLAFLMVPATITQLMSAEPGRVWVPLLLFALLLVLAARREPERARDRWRSVALEPHPVLREGVVAGVIGASAIAVWFFIVDIIAGHALFTPATLGRAMLTVFGPPFTGDGITVPVIAYTIVHYAAFIVAGIIATLGVRVTEREPSLVFGFLILFAAFEVGFYAFVALLQQASPLGALAWYQVMVGNLLAAATMGIYLWRVHPVLRDRLAHALDMRG